MVAGDYEWRVPGYGAQTEDWLFIVAVAGWGADFTVMSDEPATVRNCHCQSIAYCQP